jgi:hypothetical protein
VSRFADIFDYLLALNGVCNVFFPLYRYACEKQPGWVMRRQAKKGYGNMATQSYQIVVKGLPQAEWAARFEEAEILPLGNDQFLLRGVLSDQPALHGLLDRIGAIGLELVSVKFIPSREAGSNER